MAFENQSRGHFFVAIFNEGGYILCIVCVYTLLEVLRVWLFV